MEEFQKRVFEMLQERLGGEYVVMPMSTLKANDLVYEGVMVKKEESNTGMTMYLEGFYEKYKAGKIALSEIVELLVQNVSEGEENQEKLANAELITNISDYNSVKDFIVMKVLNEERNQEYLQDVVSIPTGIGICVCFYLEVGMQSGYTGSLTIRKSMLNLWGITPEELYEQAQKNVTRLLPHKFEDFADMKLRMKNNVELLPLDLIMIPRNRMYILTNMTLQHGATAIFYPGLLHALAEEIGTEHFVILPSSLHEVILLPTNPAEEDMVMFKEMVKDVNATHVAASEFLSDNVFHYDYATDTISVIEEE